MQAKKTLDIQDQFHVFQKNPKKQKTKKKKQNKNETQKSHQT